MSEFLRDLSPYRAHDATRAVGVLPSPFEAMHPLRTVRIDAAPIDPADDRVALVRRSAPSLQDAPASAPALSRRPVTNAEAAAIPQRPMSAALSTEAPARPPLNVDSRVTAPTSASSTRSTLLPRPVVASDHVTTDARSAPAAIPSPAIGADTTLHDRERPHPAASTSNPTLATDAPMSSRALAARTTPRTEQAPIINVTIDRIDVRAPAAPERAKASTRSRSSTPNLSLNDYLRGREPERRGGPS
jgi:hypothetical protein